MKLRYAALLGCAAAALCAPARAEEIAAATAQSELSEGTEAAAEKSAEEIIVTGRLFFRNRTEDPNPILSYDLEYFQRFEPVSVGEMLKRVPGVTFTSDVLEYDGVQMRGLPPGYTQVLINGRRAPGGEADRSFFVDRIPAELIERIEIVRSPRSDQPSEGVAGTLNIITKESVNFEGGFAKVGALINGDGKVRPSGALAYAGKLSENTSFWAGLNYQERRNPKKKVSYRFGGVPDGTRPFNLDPEFDDFEAQDDTRDGRDLSGNLELTHRFGEGGFVRIGGFFVDTDRDEDETSLTFEGADLEFDEAEIQHEEINQQTYAILADAAIPLGSVELGLSAGWSAFREDTENSALEAGEEDLSDAELVEVETIDIKDDEYPATVSLTFGKGSPLRVKAGVDYLHKRRLGSEIVFNVEDEEEEIDPAVNFRIREKRYDPYVRVTFEASEQITLDAGLRYEITRRRATGSLGSASYNAESLNPSLHLRYAPSAVDQFRLSVARTVRRPNFDLISAYEQEESPGDDDITVGNPALRNERAWGIDLGYERQIARTGVVGINFFYRRITDLIELVAIEDIGDGNLFTPLNIGKGKTWGFEVDLSTPLTAFGLPDTGLFANYTYLDSSTRDPFTGAKRRFNNQPHHVYNLGFIQTVRSLDASFGASISGRSKATESSLNELVSLRYEPDLEAFVEKRFGRHFVLRLSAQNLLNRTKKEDFRTFEDGDVAEYEIERERAGRLFQATLRAAF